MTRAEVLERLGDDQEVIFLEPNTLDVAIVGLIDRFGAEPVVCYDREKLIEALAGDMGLEDAEEWYGFNIIGAYLGPLTPVFLN